MRRFGNAHFAPRKSRSRHDAIGNESSTLSLGISQGSPTHFFVITHRLRTAMDDFIAHLLAEDFDVLTHLAVVEVVYRTTSIVCEVDIILRQFHSVAQTCQIGCRLVGAYRTLQLNGAVRIDGPNLVGSKLEVVFTERLGLVVHNLIRILRITVAVTIRVASSERSLTLYGKCHHDTTIVECTLAVLEMQGSPIDDLVLEVVQAILEPLVVCPVVVAHRSTIAIKLRTVAIGNHGASTIDETMDRTGLSVELHAEILTVHHNQAFFLQYLCLERFSGSHFRQYRQSLSSLYR